MIIYQVRIHVQADIEEEFMAWMKSTHVPDVIATGFPNSYSILKPLEGAEHEYLFEYQFDLEESYQRYIEEAAPRLREDVIGRYGGKFTASRQVYTRL